MAAEIARAEKYCQVVRAICYTQISKVKLGREKAHSKETLSRPSEKLKALAERNA